MIEVNLFNSDGIKILSFTSIEEIKLFFDDKYMDTSSPQTFLMYLLRTHFRLTHNGIEYFLKQMKIDSVYAKITVGYFPVAIGLL
jgi:hypothetical protein